MSKKQRVTSKKPAVPKKQKITSPKTVTPKKQKITSPKTLVIKKQKVTSVKTVVPKKQKIASQKTAVSKSDRFKRRKARVSKLLRRKMRQARYLLGLLASMIVADGLISNHIVNSGFGTEGNPFIESIVGQTSFISVKVAAAMISALIMWRVFRRHHRLGLASIILFVFLYTVILWWNLSVWFIGSHDVQI